MRVCISSAGELAECRSAWSNQTTLLSLDTQMQGKVIATHLHPSERTMRNKRHQYSRLFILGTNGKPYIGYFADVLDAEMPPKSSEVSFVPTQSGNRLRARQIRRLHYHRLPADVLSTIDRRWKVNAKNEDNPRFFFPMRGMDRVLEGDVQLVLGRKGTGKTAIIQHLHSLQKAGECLRVSTLSFTRFDFTQLYREASGRPKSFGQYSVLWKYITLMAAAELIAANSAEEPSSRIRVSEATGGPAPDMEFQERIVAWLRRAPDLLSKTPQKVMETLAIAGATALVSSGTGAPSIAIETTVNEQVEPEADKSLEAAYRSLRDSLRRLPRSGHSYYVVFDQLDETFRRASLHGSEEDLDYLSVIEGVILAAMHIREEFAELGPDIRPIVMLRDDVFDALPPVSSKHMWDDHALRLEWSSDDLNQLIGHRLARARDPAATDSEFHDEWFNLIAEKYPEYTPVEVMMGQDGGPYFVTKVQRAGRKSCYLEMLNRTQRTPRDIVVAIKAVAKLLLQKDRSRADEEICSAAWNAASLVYLEQVLAELATPLPDPHKAIRALKELRAVPNSFEKLVAALIRFGAASNENEATHVAEVLHQYGVIANATVRATGSPRFQYLNRHNVLNVAEPITVHKGLCFGLGLERFASFPETLKRQSEAPEGGLNMDDEVDPGPHLG